MKLATILLTLAFVMAACGDAAPVAHPSGDVAALEIVVDGDPVEVGQPARMWVLVTRINGEVVEGISTSLVDPTENLKVTVAWSTFREEVADVKEIGGNIWLIPNIEGFVTVTARMGDVENSRVVRIDDPRTPTVPTLPEENGNTAVPDPNVSVEQNGTQTVTSCQGHAFDVVSFTPGLDAGFGSQYFPDIVLDAPEGGGGAQGSYDVLSLGRLGEIILDLGDCVLVDRTGVDLIVFENPFLINGDPTTPFAELGEVAVSGDGVNFVAFPCDDSAYPFTGCAGWHAVYSSSSTMISPFDVAAAGGDQFDLNEIGVVSARYVRIRDVSDFGAAPSAGFDLDAISVVNGEVVP